MAKLQLQSPLVKLLRSVFLSGIVNVRQLNWFQKYCDYVEKTMHCRKSSGKSKHGLKKGPSIL